ERIIWDDNTSLALSGGLKPGTNGELAWKNPGNLSIGNIVLNGGVLKIGETSGSQTFGLTSNLTLLADSEIYFNGGNILNYSGAEVSVGKVLTLGGNGQLQNTSDLNLGAGGKLKLSEISVAKVITSADSLGLDVADNSTVSSLSVAHTTPVSIASGKTLSGAITVTAGSIKLDQTGTLASAIKMIGGKLDADNSMTISGAVTQAGNAAIDVQSGKTLTFDNGTINTENYQLTLEGAGTVAFPTNASGIVLNNADGIVKLNGTGVTVQAVQVSTAANAGKGILVNKSGTFSNLKISADTELNISNGKTLYGSTEVAADKTLSLTGTGTLKSALSLEGTLEAGANLTVSGAISVADNATVSIPNANTTLTYSGGNLNVGVHTLSIAGAGRFSNSSNSPIVLAVEESVLDLTGSGTITGPVKLDGEGSTLKASGSPTISGDITQSDNATIEVASNQTLSYSGTSLNLGANKLSLTGGGTLSNSNNLVLNNADSLLSLEGIGTIGVVRATVNANSGKGIQAVESATLGSFELA
ncbi:uncharacterized protein METZ01_LOCUS213691, partial [marine metagenome]